METNMKNKYIHVYIFPNQQTLFYNMFSILVNYPIVYENTHLSNPFFATFLLFPIFIKGILVNILRTKSLNKSLVVSLG